MERFTGQRKLLAGGRAIRVQLDYCQENLFVQGWCMSAYIVKNMNNFPLFFYYIISYRYKNIKSLRLFQYLKNRAKFPRDFVAYFNIFDIFKNSYFLNDFS